MKNLRLRLYLVFGLLILAVVGVSRRLPSPVRRAPQPVEAGGWVPGPVAVSASSANHTSNPVAAAKRAGALNPREDALAQVAAFDDWCTAWRRAEAAGQGSLAAAGRGLAVARRAALKHLIQTDPRRALELAVPVGLRAELPAEVEGQLERRIDARGDHEVTIACLGLVTRVEHAIVIEERRYEAFAYGRRADQQTKFNVPLHGIAIDDVAALSEDPLRPLDDMEKAAGGISREAVAARIGAATVTFRDAAELDGEMNRLLAAEAVAGPHLPVLNDGPPGLVAEVPAAAANTPWINGVKRVLWVQVDFSDDPGEVATAEQIAVTNDQVSEFYAANSQGKTTMSFTILPSTLRLPRDKSVYNASSSTVSLLQADAAVLAKAFDAANGGAGTYHPDRYDRWIVLFKRMPAYTFGGQAQLGGPQVRLNGGIGAGTTYHELGHTQGLSHSHYWLPSGASGVGPGTHVEYGDTFDAMGSSSSSLNNHFNAAQKAKLGYLDPESIVTVTAAGTYRIARHDHRDATGLRALRIAPPEFGWEYWVEHRRYGPTSFNGAQLDRLRNGVLLHWGQGKAPTFASGPGTYLIDATPGSAGGAADATYRRGEVFVDPDAGVTIKPLAVGGSAPNEFIEVEVAFGAIDGNHNPVLSAEPPPGPLMARTNIIFRASATDSDGDGLYYRWDFGDGQINPNFDNLTRRFTKGGTYSLRVSAHDGRGGLATKTMALDIADPLVTWTRRGEGVTTNYLYDVIFAGGKFVGVGINQTILHSPDGMIWTRATFPSGNSLTGIAHDGSRYVVCGYRFSNLTEKGLAAYSDDGVEWTTVNLPTGLAQFWAIAHGAGRFVAVGDTGTLYTSPNGADWTATTSGVRETLRGVSFADGLFVITGDSGRLLTSTDGLTWTNRSLVTTASFYGPARHNGVWYARSGTTSYSSPDGVTWSRAVSSNAANLGTYKTRSVGGLLMVGLTGGSIDFGESPQAWAKVQLDATSGAVFRSMAEGNGLIVAVGNGGLIYTANAPNAATSSTLIAAPELHNEADSIKVDVGRKNVLAAGGAGFTKLELYANGTKVSELNGSAGALAWTPSAMGNYSLVVRGVNAAGESFVSSAVPAVAGLTRWNWSHPSPLGNDLRGAVHVGNKWWIVGGSGAFLTLDARGAVTLLDFPTTQNLTGIAYGQGRFVACGPYYDAGAREEIGSLWTSTDGYAWTPLLTTVFDNFNLNFVSFSGDQWLAGSTGGLLLTSADGINWTRQLSGLTTSIRSAAFGNGTWIAVGAGGRAVTSTDGVRWTSRATGVTSDLNRIAFRDGMFVAVGASGGILVTGDGLGWARQTSAVSTTLSGVGFVNGRWVVAGDSGVARTSTDLTTWTAASLGENASTMLFVGGNGEEGLLLGRAGEIYTTTNPSTWTRLTQGTGEAILGVIYAGGRFVAVGGGTDLISGAAVVPVQYSTDGVTWTRAAENPAFGSLNALAYGQGRYVAVGPNSTVFTSPDAVTWTQAKFSNTVSTLVAVAAGPGAFVAASTGKAIYSSADGTNWSQRATNLGGSLRAAAYGNGRFVVVGDGGVVENSTDGLTWTAAVSGVKASLLAVDWWEEFGFIATGASGTMIGSSDGITWQMIETGVSDSITAIARTPVGFVAAAGSSGSLLISLDGANWSTATLPADRTMRGLAASPAALVAVGDGGTLLTFEIADHTPPPVIGTAPTAQVAGAGNRITLSVEARHGGGAVYQWAKDAIPIVGANSPTYVIPALSAERTGSYTVTVTTASGSITSTPALVSLGAPTDPGRLVNLSILTSLASSSDSFTFGMVVGGPGTSGSKPLLVRAVGPSLIPLGVDDSTVLQDPKLEFFNGSARVGENDNWGGGDSLRTVMAGVGAFPYANATSRDAALWLPTLESGANSARISGAGAGIVIAELYDATPQGGFTATTPRLINVSVLKHLGSGVTAGFVLGGSTARTVLVRAIGPTLGAAPFNVPAVVADPQLALFAGQIQIAANDNWGGAAALSAAFAQVGAFALPAAAQDAALLATLQPGSYTARVTGVGGTSGVALIEIYEVP